MVWTIKTLRPDARGNYNTDQHLTCYAEPLMRARLIDCGREPADVLPYDQLPLPPTNSTRHGKGMSDQAHEQHKAQRSPRGWREWTEGVPGHLVRDGKLKVGARG
jgi:hypothetical protein